MRGLSGSKTTWRSNLFMHNQPPDLTQRPPRSPRVRLGGYAALPRILDKARATLAGTPGEYIYNNPLDTLFFGFTGITAEALLEQVKTGAGDGAILEWVRANAPRQPLPFEIEAWSQWVAQRAPADVESRAFFNEAHQQVSVGRTDLVTWFDYLDLDDFVSFGGRA